MAKITVDKDQLKADIEKIKNAKTEKEVDAILAKYQKEIDAMEGAKKAPAKKTPSKTTAAKKEPAKKTAAKTTKTATKATAAKSTAKKAEEPEKKGRQYNGKYEVYQAGDGFKYNLKASNGEILVSSEVYTSRDGVIKAIKAIIIAIILIPILSPSDAPCAIASIKFTFVLINIHYLPIYNINNYQNE